MKDTKTISQLGTRAGCADMQAYTREGAAPIQEAGQKINWEKLKLPAGGKTYCVERVDHPRGGVIYGQPAAALLSDGFDCSAR